MLDTIIWIFAPTALSAAIVWLLRSWISERLRYSIENEYKIKLEAYKNELSINSNKEIENLKTRLSILASEHAVRYAKLQEKRAEVITETYAQIVFLRRLLEKYIAVSAPDDPSREEEREKIISSFEGLRQYYTTKSIFFPRDTLEVIRVLDVGLVKIFNKHAFRVEFEEDTDKLVSVISDLKNVLKIDIGIALEKLEDTFRGLLGDTEYQGNNAGHKVS